MSRVPLAEIEPVLNKHQYYTPIRPTKTSSHSFKLPQNDSNDENAVYFRVKNFEAQLSVVTNHTLTKDEIDSSSQKTEGFSTTMRDLCDAASQEFSEMKTIQKKTIKKEDIDTKISGFKGSKMAKKSKLWQKLRLRSTEAKNRKTEISSGENSLNITYAISPKRSLAELYAENGSPETIVEEDLNQDSQTQNDSIIEEVTQNLYLKQMQDEQEEFEAKFEIFNVYNDRNILLLNNSTPNNIQAFKLPGLRISLGDDSHAYTFPTGRKTLRFIV